MAENDVLERALRRRNARSFGVEDIRAMQVEVFRLRAELAEAYQQRDRIAAAHYDVCERERRLMEELEAMLSPPLILASDDACEVAAWYDERARHLLAGRRL